MISDKLKSLRLVKGYSQQQVADAVGISRQYVSKLESGEDNMPALDIAVKLADFFDISVDDFLDMNTATKTQRRPLGDILTELGHAIKEIEIDRVSKLVKVPFYGSVPCGSLTVMEQQDGEHADIPEYLIEGIRRPYVVKVCGSSLAQYGVYEGENMIVDPDARFVEGKIYVVRVDNEVAGRMLKEQEITQGLEILGRVVAKYSVSKL